MNVTHRPINWGDDEFDALAFEEELPLEEEVSIKCDVWSRVTEKNSGKTYYLYLNRCRNSSENGLYQLILNGYELYYGSLTEIHAIVKSMLRVLQNPADYGLAK